MKERAAWDFSYEPTGASRFESPSERRTFDVVVATASPLEPPALHRSLRVLAPDLDTEPLLERAPLFWTRARGSSHGSLRDIASTLSRAGVAVRYVASVRESSTALAPALAFNRAMRAIPTDWATRRRRPLSQAPLGPGQWFLAGDGGVGVDREICGTGAGTRLAIVDDDAADIEHVELDRAVSVGAGRPGGRTGHAALMAGWAAGSAFRGGKRFVGVAPDTSIRVYFVPKAASDVLSVPLAIARAVFDGADVIACATYIDGTLSPMWDDALDLAANLGRRGRGTIVVLPAGRETSSPGTSVHASLTLGFGEPASDSRVHCVSPGGRQGGWFLWRSRRGKLRPFANRGPAVRWLAPGDDVAHPFASRDLLVHAESSGAAAVAAGVILLVVACNRRMTVRQLHDLLYRTVDRPSTEVMFDRALADPADLLPAGHDPDGHNAKTGYGRLNARRACMCARDPIAFALTALGEDAVAREWCIRPAVTYSAHSARWVTRCLFGRPDMQHALRVVARHLRLVSVAPQRARAHGPGALARQLGIIVRDLLRMGPRGRALCEIATWSTFLERASSDAPSAKLLSDGAAKIFGKRPHDVDEAIPATRVQS